jgi:hypothetical protein
MHDPIDVLNLLEKNDQCVSGQNGNEHTMDRGNENQEEE